ncbi:hypothetical protein DPMN_032303 [Dreissena polymorpha]|uniref:Uncharacterized protein n=1 Tax=Dreissena polymorpha TaxID=45954 RepID=A0A9D4RIT1_DREPO|nr:hypothetical protein DPMN_032303 [Dreissena polymorpha]
MLGTFHLTKIFYGCIGKYLRNSGAETIFVENAVFGPNVVQSVLTGGNNVRSVKGFMLLGEALERLLWVEFFKISDCKEYDQDLKVLLKLQDAVALKQRDKSKMLLVDFKRKATEQFKDFQASVSQKCCQNKTFSILKAKQDVK